MAVATTVIAGIGLAITAGTTAASFAQAAKQRKLMDQANADAEKAMAEARTKLDVNYFEPLAVQKEPYELQREALLSSGAQAIQAGIETERGGGATAGRVQMAQNEAQAGIRTAQGEELSDLAKLTATEESRLRDINVQLDLENVAGAQQAAADAQQAAAAATQAGFAGLTSLGSQAVDMAPLYGQNMQAQQQALSGMQFNPEQFAKFESLGKTPRTDGFSSLDFQQVGEMDKSQYKNFLKTLSPAQKQMLFTNPNYLKSYEQFNPNPFVL
jgi:hypothetical protein